MSKDKKLGINTPRASGFLTEAEGICYTEGARLCKQINTQMINSEITVH